MTKLNATYFTIAATQFSLSMD